MATNCCTTAKRLSDMLREQQEPFLLLHLLLQDDDDIATPPPRTPAAATARRSLLRGSTAASTVTKLALRWADDLLSGCCFPRAAATRQRFCRLPPRPDRDVVASAAAVDCGRQQQQLSPVSVLDLHSDDDSSPAPSHHNDTGEDELGGDDDDGNDKPSTSGGSGTETETSQPSPPSTHDHDNDLPGKTTVMVEVERFQRKSSIAFASACDDDWETVAADYLSWIQMSLSLSLSLVEELDLSGSPTDDWRRLVVGRGGEEEVRHVAQSIEAMIFEEVRWEAVHDMLCFCSPQHWQFISMFATE